MSEQEKVIEGLAIYISGTKVKELLQARLEAKRDTHGFYLKQRDEHNVEAVGPDDDALVRDKSVRINDMIKKLDQHIRLYEFWLRHLDVEARYRIAPERHGGALAMLGIHYDSYGL